MQRWQSSSDINVYDFKNISPQRCFRISTAGKELSELKTFKLKKGQYVPYY